MKSNISATQSVSITNLKPLTAVRLEGSPAFARERAFFETCTVAAKLKVRRGEVDLETTLTVGDEGRDYYEGGPIPVRAGLVGDIARDLGVTLDVRGEERLDALVCRALAPAWGRVLAEIERQSTDPEKLARAWRRYGGSKRGAAVIKLRANIEHIDPTMIDEAYDERVTGPCHAAADAALNVVRAIIEAGGVTRKLLLDATDDESVRHVMLM